MTNIKLVFGNIDSCAKDIVNIPVMDGEVSIDYTRETSPVPQIGIRKYCKPRRFCTLPMYYKQDDQRLRVETKILTGFRNSTCSDENILTNNDFLS